MIFQKVSYISETCFIIKNYVFKVGCQIMFSINIDFCESLMYDRGIQKI